MAIKIGSNFAFQGQQPNFERDRFATKAAMKAFPETSIDDGHLSYCAEDGNTYQFKSSNTVDAVTGKWRIFKADVDLSAYATKNSVAKDLAKKVDIIGVYQSGSATNKYYSVLTIDFPKTIYETVYLNGNIICRHFTSDIMIAFEGYQPIKVKAQAYNTILTTKYDNDISFYYLIDNEGKKVNIYVETATFDQFNFKIVNSNSLDYLININAINAIPESAVKISNIGYGIKNLFYATPTNISGNPTFRAIDITDLPDLSSKYAAKAAITTINDNIADVRTSLESTQTDFVDLRNKVNAMPKTVFITQAAYNALTTKDANTIYYING